MVSTLFFDSEWDLSPWKRRKKLKITFRWHYASFLLQIFETIELRDGQYFFLYFYVGLLSGYNALLRYLSFSEF